MIFVTVGTIRFDTLIRAIDEAIWRGEIREEVLMQIGFGGEYIPRRCEYFRTAPGLDSHYERAELVIGHGGTGTTLEVLQRGLRQISVCNPSMIDNHQDEFVCALEERKLIRYCRDLALLPKMIRETLLIAPPSPLDPSMFFERIRADLESLDAK